MPSLNAWHELHIITCASLEQFKRDLLFTLWFYMLIMIVLNSFMVYIFYLIS